jgi:hypothetical protein
VVRGSLLTPSLGHSVQQQGKGRMFFDIMSFPTESGEAPSPVTVLSEAAGLLPQQPADAARLSSVMVAASACATVERTSATSASTCCSSLALGNIDIRC